jgi:hypothetical protein
MAVETVILELLKKFGSETAKNKVNDRMTTAIPTIVSGMTSKGMVMGSTTPEILTRDAMFRLWRSVIHSGDVADFIRDHQEEKIKPIVKAKVTSSTTLEQLVGFTKDAVIDLTF